MPKVALYKMDGSKAGEIELNDAVFGIEPNIPVLHQVAKALLNNKRQGTQSALTRSEVSGGGVKPWRQKGTGRARQGSTRAPQWIHGGVVFAPKSRSYRESVNRKVRRLAIRSALSSKVIEDQIIVLEDLELAAPKTKEMVKVLDNLNVNKKALVVLDGQNEAVIRASHNIPGIKTLPCDGINVLDILNYDHFIVTKKAVERIQEVYAQ